MSGKDKVKQIKRMSRKFVPRRREQKIPLRKRDAKDLRRSARVDILQELEEAEAELHGEGKPNSRSDPEERAPDSGS